MANQFFDPSFRGAGSPGAPGVGSTQRGLQQVELGKQALQQNQFKLGQQKEQARIESIIQAASDLQNIPTDEGKRDFAVRRRGELLSKGLPTQDTDEIIDLFNSGRPEEANDLIDGAVNAGIQQGFLKSPSALSGVTSGQRERAGLIKAIQPALDKSGNFDPDKADAKALSAAQALGLVAKAGTSAAERIAEDKDLSQSIADAEALKSEAKERAKLETQIELKPTLEGKLEKVKGDVKASSDIVTESFKRIGKITTNIRNIDRAINAINRGAKTGVIAKLIPNITAASRELRQIQNELGLDVIGSVTFGALSQGELDLALETAIDLGLQPEALKGVLTRKKAAQNKLIAYLDEQIQFLDDGGTLAGWRAQQGKQAVETQEAAPEQKQGGQIMVDANGNRAMVFPDGSFEEL